MSIRLIAQDLYRLIKAVNDMEKEIENAPVSQKERLRLRLRELISERNELKNMLEARKDQSKYI